MAELRTYNAVAAYLPILFGMERLRALAAASLTFTNPRAIKTFEVSTVSKPRLLSDVVAELRSTAEGDAAWLRAKSRKEAALKAALVAGKLSKVKFYRMQRGLTQGELAQAMKTKQSNISRYERTSYRASRRTLEKLAPVLGVSVADLV